MSIKTSFRIITSQSRPYSSIFSFILIPGAQKIKGVYGPAVSVNRKMEMGAGTIPGIAHCSYPDALAHLIPSPDRSGIKVSVQGLEAAGVG